MSIKKIIRYPDPFLRVSTKEWIWSDDFKEFDRIWDDLEDTLEAAGNGLALAANQIGIGWRMFAVNQAEDLGGLPPLVVNPKILEVSEEKKLVSESCLSLPGFKMNVVRPESCTLEYETVLKIDGKRERKKLTERHSGLVAQMIFHEIDHLDGKLFIDGLPKHERMKIVKNMGKR